MRRTQQLFFGRPICAPAGVGNLRAHARMLGNPYWNGLVSPAFALYVSAGGQVPTKSSRRQKSRGASKGSVHKECIRTRGGWLGRAR
jgi:hypothetical protein